MSEGKEPTFADFAAMFRFGPKKITMTQADAVRLAEAAQVASDELKRLRAALKWNIERDGDDFLICEGDHERHEGCTMQRWVKAENVATARRDALTLIKQDTDELIEQARKDGMEYAKTLVDLYAKGALKCKQCGDICHDYYPDNCTGRTQYRESEEYKRRLIYDGEYSAMRYFEKHLCRPEMMDAEDAFKALAAAICAAAGDTRPSEEIIREDRDAWPDHQANDSIRAAAGEGK